MDGIAPAEIPLVRLEAQEEALPPPPVTHLVLEKGRCSASQALRIWAISGAVLATTAVASYVRVRVDNGSLSHTSVKVLDVLTGMGWYVAYFVSQAAWFTMHRQLTKLRNHYSGADLAYGLPSNLIQLQRNLGALKQPELEGHQQAVLLEKVEKTMAKMRDEIRETERTNWDHGCLRWTFTVWSILLNSLFVTASIAVWSHKVPNADEIAKPIVNERLVLPTIYTFISWALWRMALNKRWRAVQGDFARWHDLSASLTQLQYWITEIKRPDRTEQFVNQARQRVGLHLVTHVPMYAEMQNYQPAVQIQQRMIYG